MRRFWIVTLVAVSFSTFAIADDLDVPGSLPGTTFVAATNGTESIGTFRWPNPPDPNAFGSYLFTYESGSYSIPYKLDGYETGDVIHMTINSSGVFAGYYATGENQVGFASTCSSYDCLSLMVYDDFFANEITQVTTGGANYEVFSEFAGWSVSPFAIDAFGDIIGGFDNNVQGMCHDGGLACVNGQFAIHDGDVYFNYVLENDPGQPLATVNEFTFDGTNLSVPEPSSLLLLTPGLLFAVRLGKKRLTPNSSN